ncbi:MAG: hypothetical protein HKO56_03540 [Bacteroidia bacterium]|nr:hypothetical protein [Bacteroidia bacterium]NNC85760.1 hypothetical protein [Bacteroidia bacterium]NNM15710.1 hypothetical protein [Bacteroidia bacterium]
MLLNYLDTVFKQLTELTDNLNELDYCRPLTVLSDNTIGKHVRHIIEFFECFDEGCKSGMVDYDKRERNIELEQSPIYASTKLNDLYESISSVNSNVSLKLNSMLTGEMPAGASPVETSFKRELIYTLEHAIHHMAIIEIGIKQEIKHFDLPENFGVAFSTVSYRQEECVQ